MTQKSIQEGDAFAAVCGEKEPKGRVRVLGLGPTPQSVGTPGVKSYIPTIIQMEEMALRDVELAHRDAQAEQEALRQRIVELEQQLLEERLAREKSNIENISQNGSNSQHHMVNVYTSYNSWLIYCQVLHKSRICLNVCRAQGLKMMVSGHMLKLNLMKMTIHMKNILMNVITRLCVGMLHPAKSRNALSPAPLVELH